MSAPRDRRARLLAFIKPWAECRPRYRLQLGDLCIQHDALTDESLEEIAAHIRDDFWSERERNRANRAIYARRAA